MKNFYHYFSKVVLTSLVLLSLTNFVTAQSISKKSQPNRTKELPKFNVFRPTASLRSGMETQQNVKFFELDKSLSRILFQTAPSNILFSINLGQENALEIEMERVELFSPNCKVLDANDNFIPLPSGKFYQSLSKDTTILLGFFENEVVGHLYFGDAQFHLSKITSSTLRSMAEYALYSETENHENERLCGTTGPMLSEDEIRKIQIETNNIELRSSVGPVLNMYYEVDYEAYSRALRVKPQDQTVTSFITNWLSRVFFIQKVLYSKRTGIDMRINTFKIWNIKDPYTGSDSHKLLESFAGVLYQKNFPGDFAQLIHARDYNDGIAGVARLPRGSWSLCLGNSRFSIVNAGEVIRIPPSTPYQFPEYQSSAATMAHELGHNLNADHSQSCSYTGRPLDNCSAPEGCGAGLVGPDPPAGGGHFMSYCHNNVVGRNFGTTDSRYTVIDQRIVHAWTSLPCAKDGVHKTTPDQISVTSPIANSTYKPGEQITVRWTLSTLAEVQVVLRKASNGQTWILSRQTYGFGAQERTFPLPATVVSGNDYTVRVGILGPNLELTSTFGESPRFNVIQLPDLLITSGNLTISGSTSAPHISLQNIQISNIGGLNATATRVSVLLSRDETIGSGDQLLFSFDIEALEAGRSTTKGFSQTLYTTLIANGSYYVGLIVDRSDLVKESNEQNNTFYWATPKLLVDKSSVSPSLGVSPTSLNFAASGGSENLSISSNITWNISESLNWISISSTSGSNNGSVTVSCLQNSTLSSRSGVLTLTGGGKTVTIDVSQAASVNSSTPDLTCLQGNLSITSNGNTYQIVITNLGIANQGTADAPASKFGVYLSADQQFSTADQLLTSVSINPIRANRSENQQTAVSINTTNLNPGTYYIGIIVDPESKVGESNESNNTYSWTSPNLNVESPPPPSQCTCDPLTGAQLLFCENFEDKRPGPISTQSSSNWRLWDAQSGDGYVAPNTTIGDQSLWISTFNNVETDVLWLLGNKQSGSYELSWFMFIPTGNNAYFNVQYDQNEVSHSFEVYFQNSAISLKLNGTTYSSSVRYSAENWLRLKLIIDIDGRLAHLFLDNQKVITLPYTHGKLGAIDFFAYKDINAAYWIDDFCFYKLNAGNTTIEKPDLRLKTGSVSIDYSQIDPEITLSNLRILNQGKGSSYKTKAKIYAFDALSTSPSEILIDSMVLEPIEPESYLDKNVSFKAPTSLLPGEYYIGMLIDPDNIIDETLETNNWYYWPSPLLLITSKNVCPIPHSVKIRSLNSSAFQIVWSFNPVPSNFRAQLSYDLGKTWQTYDRYENGDLLNNTISFHGIEPGKRIMFRIQSLCDNTESDWSNTLDFTLPTSAPNDDPCSATELDDLGSYSLGDLSNSKLSNLPFQCGRASKDTWFKFAATAVNMTIEISSIPIVGTDFILEIYTGSCNALQFLDCDDDSGDGLLPKITLNNLTIGKTYYIRVWDLNNLGTSFWLGILPFDQGNLINNLSAVNPSISGQTPLVKNNTGKLEITTKARQLNALTIVPNPNNGNFVLAYKSLTVGKITLTVQDPSGRIHYHKIENQETYTSQYDLNLSNLPTGLYIVSIADQQGIKTISKLIISH